MGAIQYFAVNQDVSSLGPNHISKTFTILLNKLEKQDRQQDAGKGKGVEGGSGSGSQIRKVVPQATFTVPPQTIPAIIKTAPVLVPIPEGLWFPY